MVYKGYKVYPSGDRYLVELNGVVVGREQSEQRAMILIDERIYNEN